MKNIPILFILIFGFSKGFSQQKDSRPLPQKIDSKSTNFLRSDGLYNTYDTSTLPCGQRSNERYITNCPLIIINTSKAKHIRGVSRDYMDLRFDFYTTIKDLVSSVGDYSVANGAIRATLPIVLYVWGMRQKVFIAHFEGVVKNRDTILNWHMVPPYPKAPKKFNDDFKELLKPKLLYFMESKELMKLDSLYQVRLQQ